MPTVLKQETTPDKNAIQSAAEKDGMPQEFIRDSSDLIIKSFALSSDMKDRVIESLEELLDFLEL